MTEWVSSALRRVKGDNNDDSIMILLYDGDRPPFSLSIMAIVLSVPPNVPALTGYPAPTLEDQEEAR